MSTTKTDKLDCQKLYNKLDNFSEGVIVDVRSPIEFQSEHIESSTNIPLEQLVDRSRELPLDKEIIFVCRTGVRAKRAATVANQAGLEATVLNGGILEWKKDNLPLILGQQKLPVDRQVQLTVGLGILTSLGLGLTLDKRWFSLAAIFGAGLTFAGLSGTCGLANLLEKAPWNQIDQNKETSDDTSKSCCS